MTIGSLNETIDTLTIGEMMEIEPGSVFDNDVLRNATIENLSEKVSSLFTDMTIGTLLEYANVSVSSEIAYILQDVKIADFFGALEYQNQNGQLTVNMVMTMYAGAPPLPSCGDVFNGLRPLTPRGALCPSTPSFYIILRRALRLRPQHSAHFYNKKVRGCGGIIPPQGARGDDPLAKKR